MEGATVAEGLEQGLEALPGIGARRAAALRAAWGVGTIAEFLRVVPARYGDPAVAVDGAALQARTPEDGSRVQVAARVRGATLWRRGRRSLLTVRLEVDGTRVESLYFNQPYLKDGFAEGRELRLEGRLRYGRAVQLLAPRVLAEEAAADGLEVHYPDVDGVPPAALARAFRAARAHLPGLPDPLPAAVRAVAGVPALAAALEVLHAPPDRAALEPARRRLAWGEVLKTEHRRRVERPAGANAVAIPEAAWARIRARIPFALGEEQEAAVAALRQDLAGAEPMRRLLHGEVGSGKTAVAFAAMLAVAAAGGQAALLAPTEILARQHLATFRGWLRGARLKVVGLLGDDAAADRRAALQALADGSAGIAIGTHALFSAKVRFRRLALVVFDEQHRFGVRQKAALVAKGRDPHVLTMTATPIPRTLAWARYGALEPLELRARAGAQAPLGTTVADARDWERHAAALADELRAGARAFVVAPRIDGDGGLLAWRARLLDGPWRGLRTVLAHGRMPGAEAEQAVAALRDGRAQALLGTTMVEVGLDVPDVPHMLVFGADRLGLASLHQLRGRLARGPGARPGHCLLLAPTEAVERLQVLERCVDGFQVAEEDLLRRGPGTLHGTRQHGQGGFRVFDPQRDADLPPLLRREEVRNWLATLD